MNLVQPSSCSDLVKWDQSCIYLQRKLEYKGEIMPDVHFHISKSCTPCKQWHLKLWPWVYKIFELKVATVPLSFVLLILYSVNYKHTTGNPSRFLSDWKDCSSCPYICHCSCNCADSANRAFEFGLRTEEQLGILGNKNIMILYFSTLTLHS